MYTADLKHPDQSLEQKLTRLYNIRQDAKIDFSYNPDYHELLNRLGNPHQKLPPVIHVAGTNGKGSVVAMLRAILQKAGYKPHVLTSPHLLKFNERIVIAGKQIDDSALHVMLDEIFPLTEGLKLTFFEVTTAMGFKAFADNPADITLLETGMGGRLDCTNIIEKPLLSIITRIGLDHMEFLGGNLTAIAGEKAGIIKPGVPCVAGPQDGQDVLAVFKQTCADKNSSLIGDWTVTETPRETIIFNDTEYARPSLLGAHQVENAGIALAAVNAIQDRFDIPKSAINEGLQNIVWPGRLQRITEGKLADLLPEGWELWFDGGHNESAARVLVAQIKKWKEQEYKPVHVILGVQKHKNPENLLEIMLPHTDCINLVAPNENFYDFSMAKHIKTHEKLTDSYIYDDLLECVKNLVTQGKSGCILISGSLYLAKEIFS